MSVPLLYNSRMPSEGVAPLHLAVSGILRILCVTTQGTRMSVPLLYNSRMPSGGVAPLHLANRQEYPAYSA